MRISDWSSDVCSSDLLSGDANYTLVQVSLNDLVMVIAFAPLVALLLGVTDIQVPWETLLLSVGLYVVIPRSEEHTSELQSLMRISYAVFCLKKKKKTH